MLKMLMGIATAVAIFSGRKVASRFGTNSPSTTEIKRIRIKLQAKAMVCAYLVINGMPNSISGTCTFTASD